MDEFDLPVIPIISGMSNPSHAVGTDSDTGSPGEFELIAALKRVIDNAGAPSGLAVGIGDDAAAVEVDQGTYVATTDTMVDGVHFISEKANWADVGWKSAVSNLSDIAAMGASPLHALVTVGATRATSVAHMEHMYQGMIEAFGQFGGGIVGGDVVSSPVFFVTVALTGQAHRMDGTSALLTRDTAQPGDLIGVSGKLGGSAGGLKALLEDLVGAEAEQLKKHHYRPVPRIAEGQNLIEAGIRCAMDVSDGLIADLEKICTASKVGAVINAESLPMPEALTSVFGHDAQQMALSGGEDYELLFTAPFDLMDRLLARHRGRFTHIGNVVEEPDEGDRVVVQDRTGQAIPVARKGWDHLAAK